MQFISMLLLLAGVGFAFIKREEIMETKKFPWQTYLLLFASLILYLLDWLVFGKG